MFWLRWACATAMVVSSAANAQTEQQPAAVNSGAGGSAGFQGVVLSGQAARASVDGIVVNISNTCFGTNLRHVSNPISPHSVVEAHLTLREKGALKTYIVKYPAGKVVTTDQGDAPVTQLTDLPAGVKAEYAGKNVRIILPVNFTTKVDEEGNISNDFEAKLEAVSFKQTFAPGKGGGEYMGSEGTLSATTYTSNSKDGKQYSISAFFPGENGYCGGFFSPLMVFFDDKMPNFTAVVDFPLNPTGKTMMA
ncbi:hypothetical protein [Bdellovibrio bacteriovorus]|uniref:hypothetical protein n=1 Tax=Bdellovibrio bacteriovorus TaxID=959 RepID=UPI0035A6C6D3